MGNIAYFEIPAENKGRAKKFYEAVFGWDIKKTPMGGMPDYSSITTGKAKVSKGMGELNMGGLTDRAFPNQPIMNYVQVESTAKTVELVKKNGGKQIGETLTIPTVGIVAYITDSEGNVLGLWQPEKK